MRLSASIVADKNELTLEQLQEMLRSEHDAETTNRLLRNFCLRSSSQDIQKKGMEFLYMNGYYNDLELLIKKNFLSADVQCVQWAELYQIFLDLKRKQISTMDCLQQLEGISTDDPTLLCLIEFARMDAINTLNSCGQVGNIINKTESLIKEIDDTFLTSYFKIRINKITLLYAIMKNELIMARKFGYQLLNQTENPAIQVEAHLYLGLSYTFDSHYQGMYHLNKAYHLASNNQLTNSMHTLEQRWIPFLSAHYNNTDNLYTEDKGEQAHIEIAKGNNQAAIDILNGIPLKTPFHMYYLGKAKQDRSILMSAYKEFIYSRGDYFFSRLPLNELRKL